MIKAILFDFDGVIVHSEMLHMETFLEILKPFGVSVSRKRWYDDFAGTGSRHIFSVLMSEYRINADLNELLEQRKTLYAKRVLEGRLRKTPGIIRFLKAMRKKGIKTAVVSGGHKQNITIVLKTLGMEDLFDLIIGAEDTSRRKPDPECYLNAAKALGVKPNECIGVEDSPAGSEAVKRAGMKLVLVKSPASRDLKGYVAIISKFSEFPLELINDDNT